MQADYIIHPACKLVIEEQLEKLSGVLGIIGTAAFALREATCDSHGHHDIDGSLSAAYQLLNDAFGRLVPDELELAASGQSVLARVKAREEAGR